MLLIKKQITEVEVTKFLGFEIDNMLKLEKPQKINNTKIKFSMLRHKNYDKYLRYKCMESNLLCIFSFNNEIWVNFWGNSVDSKSVFILQKRIVRIMTSANSRESCRTIFKKLKILPLAYEYT